VPPLKVAEAQTASATKAVEAAQAELGWLAPILEPGTSLDDIERHEAAVLFDFDSDLLPGASEQHRSVSGQSGESICTFWLGTDCFGLDVQLVNEVLLIDDILPVPWAPPALLGLFNSRGRIVPVVDLATLLGLPSSPEPRGMAQASPAILIKADSLVAAAIVDRPGLVIQIDRGALTPTDGGSDEPWVRGHLRPAERSHPAVTLLDPACLVQRFLDMSRFPDIRACLGSAGYGPGRATSTKNSEGGIS
jgi:purine-binding chemotaxis protein CheW